MGGDNANMSAIVVPLLALALAPVASGDGVVAPSGVQWSGTSVQDLWREYGNIFRHGNRNAASHLWSKFLLERAASMPLERFNQLSGGYCAVSGSPVTPGQHTRYRMKLNTVADEPVTGIVYYCCWPCVCDTQDFIKVDTKTVVTADGPEVHRFMVIGNPCNNPGSIPWEAPEVRCGPHGELIGAPMSDHGYVILAKFFDDDGEPANEDTYFAQHCEQRKQMGYNSGMGEIFRKVAAISPIPHQAQLPSGNNVHEKDMSTNASEL